MTNDGFIKCTRCNGTGYERDYREGKILQASPWLCHCATDEICKYPNHVWCCIKTNDEWIPCVKCGGRKGFTWLEEIFGVQAK